MVRNESDASKWINAKAKIERREGSNAGSKLLAQTEILTRVEAAICIHAVVCLFEAQSVGEKSSKQCSPACDQPSVAASCRRTRQTPRRQPKT